METIWESNWERYLNEATKLLPVGCRKIKQTTTRDAYLKKRPKSDGGGEERRFKIKRVQVFDCSAKEFEVQEKKPEPQQEIVAGELIHDDVKEMLKHYGIDESMTQAEQEALIKRETEKIKQRLYRQERERRTGKKGIRIRVGETLNNADLGK